MRVLNAITCRRVLSRDGTEGEAVRERGGPDCREGSDIPLCCCTAHGLEAAAVFSIGDYVTADEREVPVASHALLSELLAPTGDALQTHVQ